jgi:Trypsin
LIDCFVQHPDFVDAGYLGYPNDIAVITVSIPPVTVDASTRPITLADSNANPTTVTLMGWGRLSGRPHENTSNVVNTNVLLIVLALSK